MGSIPSSTLLNCLDFVFYFFRSLGIELFFIRGKLVEQSQKLSYVYTCFAGYAFEDLRGEFVINGLGNLQLYLYSLVLYCCRETHCSEEFLIGEISNMCEPLIGRSKNGQIYSPFQLHFRAPPTHFPAAF
jgi:hypothetical protein